MTSRASYSNISLPLIMENIKRFWAIAAVGFIVYFLSGPFILLMDYNHISGYMINSMLRNMNVGFMAMNLVLPIVSSAAVLRYLQTVGSTGVMHSMPFTRKSLYIGSYLSGLKLAFAPAFVIAVIFAIIMKPVETSIYINGVEQAVNVFTLGAIGNWLVESFIIIAFVYTVSMFAGMVTGNTVMHVLTALFFNFLCPLMYATFLSYAELYFYGWTFSSVISDIWMKLTPYTYAIQGSDTNGFGVIGLKATLIYAVVILIIFVVTYVLYRRRPLENATESTVFSFMEYMLGFLFVYFISTGVGLLFNGMGFSISGYVLGGLVGFLLGQMILRKTTKIFNMKSVRVGTVFAVTMLAIIVGFNMDIVGYERRLPDADNIQSVGIESVAFGNGYNENRDSFSDMENIESAIAFHKYIVENKSVHEGAEDRYNYDSIGIKYVLKNGYTMARSYRIPVADIYASPELKSIFESEETAALAEEYKSYDIRDVSIVINPYDLFYGSNGRSLSYYDSYHPEDSALKAQLLEAISKDVSDMTYEESVIDSMVYFNINVEYRQSDEPNESGYVDYSYSYSDISITKQYKNTMAWLMNNGYGQMVSDAFSDTFLVCSYDFDPDYFIEREKYMTTDEYSKNGYMNEIPQSESGCAVVGDAALVEDIINNYAYMSTRNIKSEEDVLNVGVYKNVAAAGNAPQYELRTTCKLDRNRIPDELAMLVNKYL